MDTISQTTFSCAFFFNENCCILIKSSLKYVRKGPIDNNPTLVQIMAWRRTGDKPLSEPMMISLSTHICVTQPQLVKGDCGPSYNDLTRNTSDYIDGSVKDCSISSALAMEIQCSFALSHRHHVVTLVQVMVRWLFGGYETDTEPTFRICDVISGRDFRSSDIR